MDALTDTLSGAALVALIVWSIGGLLLRAAAISCFICAVGLLALGDTIAAAGVAGCGLACRTGAQLIYRTRAGGKPRHRIARDRHARLGNRVARSRQST